MKTDDLQTEEKHPADVDKQHESVPAADSPPLQKEKIVSVKAAARSDVKKRMEADIERTLPTGESLPVLDAIQQFIDKERRRVRRTIFTLTILFMVLLIAIVGAGAFVGKIFFDQLKDDVVSENLLIRGTVDAVGARVEKIRQDITSETEMLRNNVEKDSKKLQDARSAVILLNSRITNTLAQITALRASFSDLEIENAMVANTFENKLESLTNRVEDLFWENAVLRAKLAGLPKMTAAAPEVPPSESIPLFLTPSNEERQINWRLPIPSYKTQ